MTVTLNLTPTLTDFRSFTSGVLEVAPPADLNLNSYSVLITINDDMIFEYDEELVLSLRRPKSEDLKLPPRFKPGNVIEVDDQRVVFDRASTKVVIKGGYTYKLVPKGYCR